MKPAEIRKIAGYALGSIDSVLNHWLPGGKREGEEYKPLNPKRSDKSTGSFSINTRSGQWADFSSGDKGADMVSLVAYLDDVTQSEAARRLADFLNIRIENDPPERATKPQNRKSNMKALPEKQKPQETAIDDGWNCVMPIPNGAPKPPDAHPRHGKPSMRHEYRASDGRINFYHDRYEKPEGERKQFSPLTLWRKGKLWKWQFKAPPDPKPLSCLPGLVACRNADVWILEGEKAVKATSRLFLTTESISLTWQGGSNAVAKADYTPLSRRNVII